MYYYSIYNKELTKTYRGLATLLIIAISLFFLQSISFAEIFDKSAEEYRIKGYEEQKSGNLGKALTYYAKAVSLGLQSPSVYNDMGVVYEQLGVQDKAIEFYLNAIKADPEYQPAYTNLAYLYLERGDHRNAIAFFRERIKKAPTDDPWAEKIKKELIKIDPEYKQEYIHQQMEVKRRQLEETQRQLRQKAHDEFCLKIIRSEKHLERARQFWNEKKFDEALDQFDLALAVTPDNPKILKLKKRCLYEKEVDAIKLKAERAMEKLDSGELESAKKEIQEILTAIPKEPVQ